MIIMDIEASGLAPESYPIEVAWRHRSNPKLCDSFLIKPAKDWLFWDQYAEYRIHHISRTELETCGISVTEAANRLNLALRGKTAYTDAPEYDRGWISVLFKSAGIERGFEIRSVFTLVPPSKEAAFRRHFVQKPVAHRAMEDVVQIIGSLNYISPDGA
ncbi:MAG TPA: hypothetical protein VM553_16755 [Dongiaceae bacterium]|nr:hypothetical protein [Dongiaceae bacterium]